MRLRNCVVGVAALLTGLAAMAQQKPADAAGAIGPEKLINVEFVGTKRAEAVATLEKLMGLEIQADWKSLKGRKILADEPVWVVGKQIPAGRVLSMVLGPYGTESWDLRGRAVVAMAKGEMAGLCVERAYDGRRLIPASEPNLKPGFVVEELARFTEPDPWKDLGGPWGQIEVTPQGAAVTTTLRKHQQIARTLEEMRLSLAGRPQRVSEQDDKVKRDLKTVVAVNVTKAPRWRAVEEARKQAGMNLCVDWKSLAAEGVSPTEEVFVEKKGSADEVLRSLVMPPPEMNTTIMLCTDGSGTAVLTTQTAHEAMLEYRVVCYDVAGLARTEEEMTKLLGELMTRAAPSEWRDQGGTMAEMRLFGSVLVIRGCNHTQDAVAMTLKELRRMQGK